MRIALMMLLGCVYATLTRPWSQQVELLGGGDDVMDEDETPSGKRDTGQAPTVIQGHCVVINIQKVHFIQQEARRQGKRVYWVDIDFKNAFNAMSQAAL